MMNALKKSIIILFASLLAGCATNGPTFRWVKIFEGKVGFEQASANCDYEAHLQDKADSRADSGGSIGYLLLGLPHPTKAMCMRKFGWEARKIENQEVQAKKVEPQQAEAAKLEKQIENWRIAADEGDPIAQVNLAYNYLNGYGVVKSPSQAYKWYSRAADKVDLNRAMAINAQTNIGYMWQNGLFVQKNNVKAMMWYIIASSSDEVESTKKRKNIEEIMSASEIKEAKRLAMICVSMKYRSCDENLDSQWKICEASKVLASSQEKAKIVESWRLNSIFRKRWEDGAIRAVLFSNEDVREKMILELAVTTDSMFEEKSKYNSYTITNGYGKVEENKQTGNIVLQVGKEEENFTVFMNCN